MKPLHICMISSEFPPHSAGIGYAAFHLAKALIDKNHRITVITRGSWFKKNVRSLNGITVYEIPFIPLFPPFHILYHGFFVNRLLRSLQKNIDIVHFHSPLVPIIHTSLPTVTTVHSTWYAEALSFQRITDWYSLAVHLFKKSFIANENKLFSISDKFIAVSDTMGRDLKSYYQIKQLKINIIKNSIDIKNYEKPLIKKSKDVKIFEVITIGRLVYRKGVLDIIEAAKLLCFQYPNITFTLVGEGPLKKILQNKIKEYGLENHVILKGFVPNTIVKNYLHSASIVLIPSYYEGLPIVLLEALTSAKPVIGTNISGINDVIQNGENGLLVPLGNPKAITEAILKLYNNKTLTNILGINARKTAKQYDRSIMVDKTEKLYRSVLRSS